MEFKLEKLENLVIFHNSERVPLSKIEREKKEKIYPYYGAQGIIDYVDDYIFDGDYLLIAEDGENLVSRKSNISRIASGKFWVNNHAHILSCSKDYDMKYLNFFFNMNDISGYITGSAQPKLNKKNLSEFIVKWPKELIRQRVVYILDSYDQKIETNNKIIANLEAQAQALFKYYFVDFEPFQDGKFIDSDLGPIPEGWEVIEIGSVLDFKKGRKPKKNSISYEIGIPYLVKGVIDGNELPEFTIDERIIHINDLDLFMLMDGANSGNIYFGFEGALGSTFSKLDINNELVREIIYQFMILNLDNIKNQNTGSAIPHANKDYINKMKLALPNEDIMKFCCANFRRIRQTTISLKKQNQTLAETRDALLPKLMAWEIDLEGLGGFYD